MYRKIIEIFVCMLLVIIMFSSVVFSDAVGNDPPNADTGGPYYGTLCDPIYFIFHHPRT